MKVVNSSVRFFIMASSLCSLVYPIAVAPTTITRQHRSRSPDLPVSDKPCVGQEVQQASGTRIADAQLALQQRGRHRLLLLGELPGALEQRVLVVRFPADERLQLLTGVAVGLRMQVLPARVGPIGDEARDLAVRHVAALEALRASRISRQVQHIT